MLLKSPIWSIGCLYMQPIIKFEEFGQIISINADSNLPGAHIFRSPLGLYDNLLLIYRRTPPPEASVGACSIE